MLDIEVIVIAIIIVLTLVAKDVVGDRKYNKVSEMLINLVNMLGLSGPKVTDR